MHDLQLTSDTNPIRKISIQYAQHMLLNLRILLCHNEARRTGWASSSKISQQQAQPVPTVQ
jgi:hypothetical protein